MNIEQVSQQVRIVLVNPHQPGNIGGAMRAMKNMQLQQLYLVQPEIYPSDRIQWRAAGAIDMQKNIVVCDSVEQAIADCHHIVGTSARSRKMTIPADDPKQCCEKIVLEVQKGSRVALLFGREHSGLTNGELQLCHRHVTIPANPEYSSLNLASAVQVLCYQLYQQCNSGATDVEVWDKPLATAAEIDLLLQEAQKIMAAMHFYKEKSSKKLIPRLQRLLNRVRPDVMEVQILRGFLSRIEELLQQVDGHKSKQ